MPDDDACLVLSEKLFSKNMQCEKRVLLSCCRVLAVGGGVGTGRLVIARGNGGEELRDQWREERGGSGDDVLRTQGCEGR